MIAIKEMKIPRTKRKQMIRKAFVLYRRHGYGFAYRWALYFNLHFSRQRSFKDFLRGDKKE